MCVPLPDHDLILSGTNSLVQCMPAMSWTETEITIIIIDRLRWPRCRILRHRHLTRCRLPPGTMMDRHCLQSSLLLGLFDQPVLYVFFYFYLA